MANDALKDLSKEQLLELIDLYSKNWLALALAFRFYGNLNRQETVFDGNRMLYRNLDCRVQTARKRKGLPFHPCKSVGIIEYSEFAQVLDNRIRCRCISCYSDAVDSVGCAWEFTLEDEE